MSPQDLGCLGPVLRIVGQRLGFRSKVDLARARAASTKATRTAVDCGVPSRVNTARTPAASASGRKLIVPVMRHCSILCITNHYGTGCRGAKHPHRRVLRALGRPGIVTGRWGGMVP